MNSLGMKLYFPRNSSGVDPHSSGVNAILIYLQDFNRGGGGSTDIKGNSPLH